MYFWKWTKYRGGRRSRKVLVSLVSKDNCLCVRKLDCSRNRKGSAGYNV